jgi:ribA/ribD-fused uncharacterized protein
MMQAHETRTWQQLVNVCHAGARPEFLFFWMPAKKTGGAIGKECLSQWYEAPFVLNGRRYPTAEHYMMAQKALLFGDATAFAKVMAAETPGEAKAVGREVRSFRKEQWQECAFAVVVTGNMAKFQQNSRLLKFLLATGEHILAEASPYDRIWGIGLQQDDEQALQPAHWNGLNQLGFALMEVRARLEI